MFCFKTDKESEKYCMLIVDEMVKLFEITRKEAIERINRRWDDLEIVGHDLIYHELPTHWAKDIYYGHNSFWWQNEDNEKLKPLPSPLMVDKNIINNFNKRNRDKNNNGSLGVIIEIVDDKINYSAKLNKGKGEVLKESTQTLTSRERDELIFSLIEKVDGRINMDISYIKNPQPLETYFKATSTYDYILNLKILQSRIIGEYFYYTDLIQEGGNIYYKSRYESSMTGIVNLELQLIDIANAEIVLSDKRMSKWNSSEEGSDTFLGAGDFFKLIEQIDENNNNSNLLKYLKNAIYRNLQKNKLI